MNRIEEEFEPTDSEQIEKLLKGMNRRNTKPTIFLRERKTLAKDRVDNSVLKEVLLAQLSPVTAGILEMKEGDINEIAKLAEKGCAQEGKQIAEVTTQEKNPNQMETEDLVGKIIEALHRWNLKDKQYKRRGRSPTPSRYRNQRNS